jgi:hypothetical protein
MRFEFKLSFEHSLRNVALKDKDEIKQVAL